MSDVSEHIAALIPVVEDQGGRYLEGEPCRPKEYGAPWTGDQIKGKLIKPCPGNGAPTRFEIPYDAVSVTGASLGVQPIELCGVEDLMWLMPRFAQAVDA